MAFTEWDKIYLENGGHFGDGNDAANEAAWNAAWDWYWKANPNTRDNEIWNAQSQNNFFNDVVNPNIPEFQKGGDKNTNNLYTLWTEETGGEGLTEKDKIQKANYESSKYHWQKPKYDSNNQTPGKPQNYTFVDEHGNPTNFQQPDTPDKPGTSQNTYPSASQNTYDSSGTWGQKTNEQKTLESDSDFWNTANRSAVKNFVAQHPEYADKYLNNNKRAGENISSDDINWGALEEDNFWKNSDNSNKSLRDVYTNNGVSFDNVMSQLTPDQQEAILNKNALAYSKGGNVTDWFIRDTASGEPGFSNQDIPQLIAAIKGLDSISDGSTKNLFSQFKRTDAGHENELEGQDYLQFMYNYDKNTGRMNSSRFGNDITVEDFANKSIANPGDLSKIVYEDPGSIYTQYAGSSLNDLNKITDTMAKDGIWIKNPDGSTNPNSLFDIQNIWLKAKKKAEESNDENALNKLEKLQDGLDEEKRLENARLNSVIIADAIGKGAQNLSADVSYIPDSLQNQILAERENAINRYLNYNDTIGDTNYSYNLGNFRFTGQPTGDSYNVNSLVTASSPISPSLSEDWSWNIPTSNNGNLNINEIEKALRKRGLRRQ